MGRNGWTVNDCVLAIILQNRDGVRAARQRVGVGMAGRAVIHEESGGFDGPVHAGPGGCCLSNLIFTVRAKGVLTALHTELKAVGTTAVMSRLKGWLCS